jgi:acyl-CoA thioesterase-1
MLITIVMLTMLPAHAYSASKTALVLGDSLSAEYGIVRGSGWVALLQARLQREHIAFNVVNASISGETTSGGWTRLPALLEKHRPSLLIIELGANDALRGLALNATEQNLREMISAAKKYHTKVVLLGMQIPPNYGPDYTQKFSRLYASLAKQTQSPLVPFFLEKVVIRPELMQADRLHPTAEAQALMLDSVWPTLLPLFGK